MSNSAKIRTAERFGVSSLAHGGVVRPITVCGVCLPISSVSDSPKRRMPILAEAICHEREVSAYIRALEVGYV